MKGKNEFRLNEATMIEAVQEYLDRRYTKEAPRVESVEYQRTATSSAFVVRVQSEEEDDE